MPVEELTLRAGKTPIPLEPPAQGLKNNSFRLAGFLSATMALMLGFTFPLYNLLRLAAGDSLYSDIPLIPLISLYLIWLRRENLPRSFKSAIKPAIVFFGLGFLMTGLYVLTGRNSYWTLGNYLALNIFALLVLFIGICFLFFGVLFVRAVAFPLALLIFTVPLPDFLRHWMETFLQNGSAAFAGIFFQWSNTPFFRDGLDFHLPGCIIQVAPECSGIHSTLALTITSLIGGWLFLCSPWKRAVLTLAVIPLALIRNGFRIYVIGSLCAARGPQMLDSPIHHHGGPLFFILSLIPLFLLLLFLRKTEPAYLKPPTKKSL